MCCTPLLRGSGCSGRLEACKSWAPIQVRRVVVVVVVMMMTMMMMMCVAWPWFNGLVLCLACAVFASALA